ncbi:cation:proton antiporter [Ferrimicrobium sp.]|uniref:cation:proton antiporter domain-containing protein n=1 Tax=Ferrimicrobium sp. TaxID=2926050 RepID=UPI00262082C5|nr:cation:proton antiporter [Ferrimicrobium sp.]
MTETVMIVVVGLVIGTIPQRWLRIPEPIVLLVVGALMRSTLGANANAASLSIVAYIGLFALLFGVGVELADLGHRPLTPRGLGLASIGATVLGALGFAMLAWQRSAGLAELALILSAIPTSAGIAARLLRPHGTGEGSGYPIIISAAVADDFFGIALLVLAPLFAAGATFGLTGSPTIALAASLVIVGAMLLIRPKASALIFTKVVVLTIGGVISGVSAALLGVFDGHEIAAHLGAPARRWLPFLERLLPTVFFMVAGYDIRLPLLVYANVLLSASLILVALLISRLAIGAATPGDLHVRIAVGAGMLARGEVTIAMALVFLQSGVLSNTDYAILMAVVLGSTLLSGLALRLNRLGR